MVLVTGASGFLGSELVKQLVANGEQVRIIKRPNSNVSHLTPSPFIEIVEGDILDVPSLEAAFEQVEKVYHLAAIIAFDSPTFDAMYKCNIEGTANVVNVALSKGVKKLLYVSSIAAIGGKPNELITETTKWEQTKWTSNYGITKMLAEREVWRGIQEGLEAVIVNPGIIIGLGNNPNKATNQLFDRIAHGKMPFYSNGINGFVSVTDVANICIQLMNSNTHSERFILVSDNCSYKQYFDYIATALNVAPPKRILNKYNGFVAVLFDKIISKITQRKRKLTTENLTISLASFEYSNAKIKQQLNYNFTSIENTVNSIALQINKHE